MNILLLPLPHACSLRPFCVQYLSVPSSRPFPCGPRAPRAHSGNSPSSDASDPAPHRRRVRLPTRITDVASPTLAFYPAPDEHNTGKPPPCRLPRWRLRPTLHRPRRLTDICAWLNRLGVNCALVRYRVPEAKRKDPDSLEQASKTPRPPCASSAPMPPSGISTPTASASIGFSAGAHLAVAPLRYMPGEKTPGFPDRSHRRASRKISPSSATPATSPPIQIVNSFNKAVGSVAASCPAFIFQAENDPVHVDNAVKYFVALKNAKVPSRTPHLRRRRPRLRPPTHRQSRRLSGPSLAATWLHTIPHPQARDQPAPSRT